MIICFQGVEALNFKVKEMCYCALMACMMAIFSQIKIDLPGYVPVSYTHLDVYKRQLYFVDVPGYGYAKVANNVTKQFGKTMDEYISERQTLRGFILLVDYRHKPTKDDVMMYEFVKHHGVPVIVVATKEDKLKRNDLKKNEKLIKDTLHFDPSDTFIRFSSLKKKGIQEAWNAIYELCDLDFE